MSPVLLRNEPKNKRIQAWNVWFMLLYVTIPNLMSLPK